MPKIIISYRRSDSDAIAGRIRDRLAGYYGDDSIFMDIDNIPFGADFREHIQNAIVQNDLLLAVVGPKWSGPGEDGRARLENEMDLVRIEIETALKQGIPVVPVLVHGAKMPSPADLPETLKDFSFKNAADVEAGRDFHQHVDRLIRSIDKMLNAGPKAVAAKGRAGAARPFTIAAILVAVIAVVMAGIWAWMFASRTPELSKQAAQGGQQPARAEQGEPASIIVEFAELKIGTQPIAARPYLHDFGISAGKLDPAGSEIVIVNNRGLYEGGGVKPTTSQNFLTQINTNNVVASFTLTFEPPLDSFSFTRPALYAATQSGVTHPGWNAVALDANGNQLSAQSESLIRSFTTVPAQSYTFRAPGLDQIAAMRFQSDPRLNGRPFAAFSTLLIERLTLHRSKAAIRR